MCVLITIQSYNYLILLGFSSFTTQDILHNNVKKASIQLWLETVIRHNTGTEMNHIVQLLSYLIFMYGLHATTVLTKPTLVLLLDSHLINTICFQGYQYHYVTKGVCNSSGPQLLQPSLRLLSAGKQQQASRS